jgi:hypothetical protein
LLNDKWRRASSWRTFSSSLAWSLIEPADAVLGALVSVLQRSGHRPTVNHHTDDNLKPDILIEARWMTLKAPVSDLPDGHLHRALSEGRRSTYRTLPLRTEDARIYSGKGAFFLSMAAPKKWQTSQRNLKEGDYAYGIVVAPVDWMCLIFSPFAVKHQPNHHAHADNGSDDNCGYFLWPQWSRRREDRIKERV